MGNLGIQKLTLTSNGSADLSLNVDVDVANVANFNTLMGTTGGVGGMVVQFVGAAKFDAYMQGVTLGGSAAGAQIAGESIGDIKITGLDLTGVKVGVTGH